MGQTLPVEMQGCVREEDCPAHKHVEWDVSYEALQRSGGYMTSSVLRINKQSYSLQVERCWNGDVKLSLSRDGPREGERSYTGRCWTGIKCSDGTYHHRNETGKFLLNRPHDSFLGGYYFYVPLSDLNKRHLGPNGRLTLFFRMNVDRSPAEVQVCNHGKPPTPAPPSGSIREEKCPTHRHVEWDVVYETPADNDVFQTSPVFEIGPQVFFFETRYDRNDYVSLRLYRLGSPFPFPATARFWLGLQCDNGSNSLAMTNGTLDMRDDLGLWTVTTTAQQYTRKYLEEEGLTSSRSLTFFFRLNVESNEADACTHGIPRMSMAVSGSVREEQCSTHKHVEWDAGCAVPVKESVHLRSPVFEVGGQAFFMDVYSHSPLITSVTLSLSRYGRSEPRSVRWWAGLKFSDGTLPLRIFSGKLNLQDELGLWTGVTDAMRFGLADLVKQHNSCDRRLLVFFRMSLDPTGDYTCIHGMPSMPSEVSGSIQEVLCASHKHVEWNVDYQVPENETIFLASPVFEVRDQTYFLDLRPDTFTRFSLTLFRIGRPVPGDFRWWAGLRLRNGIHPPLNVIGELDLREDLGLWTLVSHMWFTLPESDYLKSHPRLTIFFRLNVEPSGEGTCPHGLADVQPIQSEGSIRVEDCPSHKYVEWDTVDLTFHEERRTSLSPVFEVGDQRYLLCLSCFMACFTLDLYRNGRSDRRLVRCWAAMKLWDGTYHHRMRVSELDLGQEYSLWSRAASFRFMILRPSNALSEWRFAFCLRMDAAATSGACAHGAVQMCPPGEGVIRQSDGQLVEWDVVYEAPNKYAHLTASPAFQIGGQSYLLELLYQEDGLLALSLYRSGLSVEGRDGLVKCWVGLGCDGWTYRRRTKFAELDLREESELWTKAAVLRYFRRSDLERRHVSSDGRLIFFLLVETNSSVDVAVQTDGQERDRLEDENVYHTREYEDRVRQDYRLWRQNPEEGDRIRRYRRAEAEARLRERRTGQTEDRYSFSAA